MPIQPIRVLVVDDDARVRAAIRGTVALEADLLLVGESAAAAEARALAAVCAPSVALVDVLLPDDVTGLALVTSLGHRAGCAVVAMSVRGSMRKAALASGAIAFVEKGEEIDVLLTALRGAADQRA